MKAVALLLAASLGAGTSGAAEIYRQRSLYEDAIVTEDKGLRCMQFGLAARILQTCVDQAQPDRLVFPHTRMLMAALYLNPTPRNVLVIGLGGGTVPLTLARLVEGATIESVELDPAVVKVAQRYFGFAERPGLTATVEDGRVFVKRAQRQSRRYDLIVLDTYGHQYIPEHMLTREFLLEVKSLLAPGGVVAANTHTTSKLFFAESATYHEVFGPFFSLTDGNRVILARPDGLPTRAQLEQNAERLEARLQPFGTGKAYLLPLFSSRASWPRDTRVLTDQYSPANLLNAPPARP
jgi:spermidine synthase